MRIKQNIFVLFFVLVFLFVLSSLFVYASQPLPILKNYDPDGQLVLSLGGEVSVLNPILSTDTSSSAVEGVVFSGLTRINENLEIIPDMAKSWEISADGKIWTIYLKENIKWHDGFPFTSEDVKFTFDSILNPKVNSIRRSDFIIDNNPIKFKIINKYAIRAILPKPFAPFLSRLGIGIIPRHLFYGKDINTCFYNRKPIGTGPFKFVEWKTGDYVKVVRNENYYKKPPYLAGITFKIIPDENSTLVALEASEIDSAGIPAKDYSRMKKVKGIRLYEYDTLLYVYLGLNNDTPLFKDKKSRQALSYAINKKQLVSLVLKKLGTKAYSPAHPLSWAYSDDVKKFEYDPTKALELLNELGWKLGKDGFLNKNNKKFEFTCLVNYGNKEREKAAIIIKQNLKSVGIKMNIKVLEWASLLKILNNPNPPKNFDAVIMGWSLGLDPDSYSIWHSSQYYKGFNFVKYINSRVDKLLEMGRIEMNKNKRKEIYIKLNKVISEDCPYIFLWYPHSVVGVKDRVCGLSKPGPAGIFLNIEDVFILRNRHEL